MFFGKKILKKAITIFALAAVSFLALVSKTEARNEDCSTREFSNGSLTKTLNFSAGGGTNTDAKITLPIGAKITSASVILSPDALIKTPHIWVPKSDGMITQIRTSDGTIVKAYATGLSWPSRTFVIPGGDVWTADRAGNSVTKLSPKTGTVAGGACGDAACNTNETFYSCASDCPNTSGSCGGGTYGCEEYKVSVTYATGGGPRGVTSDIKGYIWVGNCNDGNVVRMDPKTGSILNTVITGGCPYGAIGDSSGQIWISNRGAGQGFNIINTVSNSVTKSATLPNGLPYGIGMDKNGNVYIAGHESGNVYKYNSSGNLLSPTFSTGVASGPRGVAVDSRGNVWTANSANNHLYGFNSSGSIICDFNTLHSGNVGVAVDFNDKIWVVSNDGSVSKIKYEGGRCSEELNKNIGATLYNYSDMTGLRSIPTSMSIGTTQIFPTSGGVAYTGWETALQAALSGCSCPDASGDNQCKTNLDDPTKCDVPLSLFSVTGGTYEAKSLNIGCTTAVAPVLGGLIPCGRLDDNLATSWNETNPCNLCFGFLMLQNVVNWLAQIAVGIAVFILIIAGLFYVFSSGEPGKIEFAKSVISYALTGLALVFIAWLLTGVIIAALGYSHPFSGGSWNIVDCPIS